MPAPASSAFETKAPSRRAESLVQALEDATPRGRSFRYTQDEFLADVFGSDSVPRSKPTLRAPPKAWGAPSTGATAMAGHAASAKSEDKAPQLQQPAESPTEELQQLKAYAAKLVPELVAQQLSKQARGGRQTKQQLCRIGLGPPRSANLAEATAEPPPPRPKQQRRAVAVVVPAGVDATLDIERKAISRATAAAELRKKGLKTAALSQHPCASGAHLTTGAVVPTMWQLHAEARMLTTPCYSRDTPLTRGQVSCQRLTTRTRA